MSESRQHNSKPVPIRVIQKTTTVLAVSNGALAILQAIVAFFSGSTALLADALHTISDLCIDLVVFCAGWYGAMPADKNYPYGHRRIETVTAIMLAGILCAIGISVIFEVATQHTKIIVQSDYVMLAAAISVMVNEGLYRYTEKQAQLINSQLLHVSAKHQRSDALSSIVVLFSAASSYLFPNYPIDAYAALFIAAMVLKMGLGIAYAGIIELIDNGISRNEIKAITKKMLKTPGVNDIHLLRSRKMAGDIFLDVHIITTAKISVSEGHFIGEKLRHSIQQEFQKVVDITVHIDPEDDEDQHNKECKLPDRGQIYQHLTRVGILRQVPTSDDDLEKLENSIIIHYLNNHVELQVCISTCTEAAQQATDRDQYTNACLQKLRQLDSAYHSLQFFQSYTCCRS